MNISGLLKTSLLDYPGHVAATIFLGGCNFRCPFCHNMDIVIPKASVLDGNSAGSYSEEDILIFLKKRAALLDGVCITGGEPTLYKELPDFIRKIKNIENSEKGSLLVKLDTNGTNPDMIQKLINAKLVDYIAMDIKSSIEKYGEVAGIDFDEKLENKIRKSIEIITGSDIDHEFRTTIVKKYHDEDTMIEIGKLIKGAKSYYLQSFIDSEFVPDHSLKPWDKETLLHYKEIMGKYVGKAELRGVD